MNAARIWLEVATVMLLTVTGLVLGGMTGWIAASSLVGTVFGLTGATWLLGRQGTSWRDLGFAQPMRLRALLGYTAFTLVAVFVATTFVVTPVLQRLGAAPLDVTVLQSAVEGNLTNYLIFLIPISWGSAAFGEELLARGFIQYRFTQLAGRHVGVALQAAVFAMGHFYQGIMGVANIFVLALIFGFVYDRCGRNLWPLIVAHGITDTIGITALYLGQADLLTGSG
jgi:membrane protease YdiL (CAAX protease family)